MRLLVDEMWPAVLAEELRERGHDVVAVQERPELLQQADEVVLRAAAAEGRAVFTENVSDFLPLAAALTARGERHGGMVLTSNSSWPRGNPRTLGRAVKALSALMSLNDGGDALADRIEWLVEA